MRWRGRVTVAILLAAVLLAVLAWNGRERAITAAYGRPDSTQLELSVASCNENPRAEVEESDTTVRVRAVSSRRIGQNSGDCLDSASITLRSPLGDRNVVDFDDDEIPLRPADGSSAAHTPAHDSAASAPWSRNP